MNFLCTNKHKHAMKSTKNIYNKHKQYKISFSAIPFKCYIQSNLKIKEAILINS